MSNHELSLCGEDAPAFIFECNRYQREAPRFAALFREVWGRIPDTDRKAIVQYARSKRLAQPYVFVWLKKSREMQSPAHYDDGKKWMVFDGERILGLPGNGIALAIAKELGHLYLYAIGDDTHTAPRPKERQAIIEWD